MKKSLLLLFLSLQASLSSKLVFAQSNPHPLGTFGCIGNFCPTDPNNVTSSTNQVENVLSIVIGFLTIFAGLYFLVNFIVGGLNWATAGGDSNKVEEAKKRMTNGALGLIIVIASYSVIYIVGKVLGLDILNLSALFAKSFK